MPDLRDDPMAPRAMPLPDAVRAFLAANEALIAARDRDAETESEYAAWEIAYGDLRESLRAHDATPTPDPRDAALALVRELAAMEVLARLMVVRRK